MAWYDQLPLCACFRNWQTGSGYMKRQCYLFQIMENKLIKLIDNNRSLCLPTLHQSTYLRTICQLLILCKILGELQEQIPVLSTNPSAYILLHTKTSCLVWPVQSGLSLLTIANKVIGRRQFQHDHTVTFFLYVLENCRTDLKKLTLI